MEKHVNILLEQISESLEKIKDEQEASRKPSVDPILKVIEQRLQGVEAQNPMINSNLANLGSDFLELSNTIKSFEPVNKTKVEHVFFPGIQSWIDSLKRWKFVFLFIFISAISIAFNVYSHNLQNKYKEGYYKHKAVLYSNYGPHYMDSIYSDNEDRVIHFVDSIDARIDERKQIEQEMRESKRKADELAKKLEESE